MPDTAVLPLPAPPTAGGYTLRRDRCVVELSVRLLRLPVLRGRLTATGGDWTPGSGLTVVLDSASLRTGVPFLHRALTGPRGLRGAELTFVAEEVEAGEELVLDGRVQLPDATREARLRGDIRYQDEECVVVWAAGVIPPPRRKPRCLGRIARLLAGRRLHVEIAIEFVR
jgi:hypothetical protein